MSPKVDNFLMSFFHQNKTKTGLPPPGEIPAEPAVGIFDKISPIEDFPEYTLVPTPEIPILPWEGYLKRLNGDYLCRKRTS